MLINIRCEKYTVVVVAFPLPAHIFGDDVDSIRCTDLWICVWVWDLFSHIFRISLCGCRNCEMDLNKHVCFGAKSESLQRTNRRKITLKHFSRHSGLITGKQFNRLRESLLLIIKMMRKKKNPMRIIAKECQN